MTGLARFRVSKLFNYLIVAIIILACPVKVLSVDTIQSTIYTPIPTRINKGSLDHIHAYIVAWDNPRSQYELLELDFDVPAGAVVQYYSSNKFAYYRSKQPISNLVETKYKITTGTVVAHYEYESTSPDATWYRAPSYVPYYPNNTEARYFICDASIVVGSPQDYIVSPFVIWTDPPIEITSYKAYMGEPVADDHNAYMIMGYGDHAELLWISQRKFEYYQNSTQNPSVNDINGYWDESIILSSSAQTLTYNHVIPSALLGITYTNYIIQITCYDLTTGQYLRSAAYSGNSSSDAINIDISSFMDISSLEDITCYGLDCIVDSLELWRSRITWNVDPLFETWQANVINYLDLIYKVLSQDGEEVTINQDQSDFDEVQSAKDGLAVTDSSGQTVDAAAQASEAFSDANKGIEDLAAPISSINDNIMQNVFFEPILLVPIVVALALGLLITILGKNKSD